MDKEQTIQIRLAAQQDLAVMRDMATAMRLNKEAHYFEHCLNEQDAGKREIYIADYDGVAAAYTLLNWQPKYGFYKKQGIPETQDLNVLPSFRRRGIATALIRHCETRARAKGYQTMGISVGLDASYGPAQILYVKLGYIPDGQGVTYDRQRVGFGEFRAVDNNLCLMMVKNL